MDYIVHGARKADAVDQAIMVTASSAAEAEKIANAKGMFVERVVPLGAGADGSLAPGQTTGRKAPATWKIAALALSLVAVLAIVGVFALQWGMRSSPRPRLVGTNTPQIVPNATGSSETAEPRTPAATTASSPPVDVKTPRFKDLDQLSKYLTFASFGDTSWELAVEHEHKDHAVLVANEQLQAIREGKVKYTNPAAQGFVDQHSNAISALFGRLGMAGESVLLFMPAVTPPVSFAEHEGELCFVIGNMTTGVVYNTIKLTSKERAATVVKSSILSILSSLDASLYGEDIPYYAVVHYYGSKNFLDKSADATKGEIICVIFKREDIREYVTTKISQEELLRRSVVLLKDRDSGHEFSRVEIILR